MHLGRLGGDAGLRRPPAAGNRDVPAAPEYARLSRERLWAHRRADRDLLVDRRTSAMEMGRQMITNNSEQSLTCQTSFPDLAPWLDNVSDGYDELPSSDTDVPYDE